MSLDILFLEFQFCHCYLMHLILDHQMLQQYKVNVTELHNHPFVITRHGLDKNALLCGIFLKQTCHMLFRASCFL